jgi:hypothetical protein
MDIVSIVSSMMCLVVSGPQSGWVVHLDIYRWTNLNFFKAL